MSNSGYITGYGTEVVSDPVSGYGLRAVVGSRRTSCLRAVSGRIDFVSV